MKALLQRVSKAAVSVDGAEVSAIGPGLLILLGVEGGDDAGVAERLARKAAKLRIFADEHRPLNRSVVDVDGEVLVVSQFTLVADVSRGNRPGFPAAAPPDVAEALYDHFVAAMRRTVRSVQTGVFRTDMAVSLVNDGPVTIWLES